VWPELKEEIELELAQLQRLMNEFAELRKKVKHTNPDTIELVALAGFLHTFYTGVENIFKRVEVQLDKKMSDGAFWHSQLLERMAQPSANHPPVISEKMRDMLRQYLNFRHVFRHAYSFELQWTKMAPLISESSNTFQLLEADLKRFIKESEPGNK
jgi:HepT-like protein